MALAILAGCTTQPESLHLDFVSADLASSRLAVPARPEGERAIVITFEGNAPFAVIRADGKQAQFRCQLFGVGDLPFGETTFGLTFFDGAVAAKDAFPTRLPAPGWGERYRYKAFAYFGLKARTHVDGPDDIDLLRADYDHLACRLVGVQMVGPFIASNEFLLSKARLEVLATAYGTGR